MTNEQLLELAGMHGAALEPAHPTCNLHSLHFTPEQLATFAAALASQGEAAYLSGWDSHAAACRAAGCAIAAPKPESQGAEPVAWRRLEEDVWIYFDTKPEYFEADPLYAAPKLASAEPSDERSERLTAACAKVFGWPASDTAAGAADHLRKDAKQFADALENDGWIPFHPSDTKALVKVLRSIATPPAATQVPSEPGDADYLRWLAQAGGIVDRMGKEPRITFVEWSKWQAFCNTVRSVHRELRTPAAPEAGSYADAFYELAALMGIGAQSLSPAVVWRGQMLPRLRTALHILEAGPNPEEIERRRKFYSAPEAHEAGSDSTDAAREAGNDPTEKQRRLYELADRIDHEQLWSWAGMDHHKLTPEQRDRMDAGVELRRYGAIWKADRWIVVPPTGPTRYSAVTLDGAVKMAKKDEERKASGSGKGQA